MEDKTNTNQQEDSRIHNLSSKWDRTLLWVSKLFRNSQKICRGIAILDAVVSIIILAVLIARKVYTTTHRRAHLQDAHLSQVLLLAGKLFEIVFAIILYEGVRRKIKWMVKWWLIYCIGRLIVYPFVIYSIFVSPGSSLISIRGLLVCLGLTWVIFQLIQGIIILAIHKNPTDEPSADEINQPEYLEFQSDSIIEEPQSDYS